MDDVVPLLPAQEAPAAMVQEAPAAMVQGEFDNKSQDHSGPVD